MDISFQAFKTEYETKMQSTLNPLINEFSDQYLQWKQTKLLELMNKNIEILVAAKPAKKRLI